MPAEPSESRLSPAMQQYHRFKQRHPGCLLFFRIGDFYELFDDDAVKASKLLGLTLTQRQSGIPMAGVPFHQLETYLKRLVALGQRVAVGEQLIDASQAKGIVPRAVTRVLSPGTLVDDALLEDDAPATLAAIVFTGDGNDSPASLAIVEVATGSFVIVDCESPASILDEVAGRGVRELLYAEPMNGDTPPRVSRVLKALSISGTARPGWHFRPDESLEALLKQFGVTTLAGFGLSATDPALPAAGAIVRYLSETQTISDEAKREARAAGAETNLTKTTLAHLRPPRREVSSRHLTIDAVSLRALEIVQTMRGGAGTANGSASADGSLLGLFLTGAGTNAKGSWSRTAMGKRLLREWFCRPLRSVPDIQKRQSAVATLLDDRTLAAKVGEELSEVQDIARIAGRLALGRATPRDVLALARSLARAERIAALLEHAPTLATIRTPMVDQLPALATTQAHILATFVDEPPAHTREGGIFKDGVDASLDESRLLQRDAGAWLAEYQARLIAEFNLPSLKVGFNRIFGYYIELPQAQARQAPPQLSRKQTLKNAERFTTPELAEFERKVSTAESRAVERERELFIAACEEFLKALAPIAIIADALSTLDCLLAFADKSHKRGWVRPELVERPILTIHGGRHPVLDEMLGGQFVPNDATLGGAISSSDAADGASALALITGPNMAGKSTFIRQVALITLLAHTGCFVPADRATIGLTDRIFTRIGADDALHAGQSTFMVEMIETANILNHATPQSLVVLDEIGRGTSTLDGLSLAWAIAEHLAGDAASKAPGPRTLFATHYHELTDLEHRLPGRVTNLHVAVREWPPGDPHAQIVFLHRIQPGRADQSYGVHVARLAGIPRPVIDRAREVLAGLAVHQSPIGNAAATDAKNPASRAKLNVAAVPPAKDGQFSLFTEFMPHPAVEALKEVKLESLTPMQAFDQLRRVVELLK
jgi:DNA mismatch repair protein MutS